MASPIHTAVGHGLRLGLRLLEEAPPLRRVVATAFLTTLATASAAKLVEHVVENYRVSRDRPGAQPEPDAPAPEEPELPAADDLEPSS